MKHAITEIPKRSLESLVNELTKHSNLNNEDIPTLLEHIKKLQNKGSPMKQSILRTLNCLSYQEFTILMNDASNGQDYIDSKWSNFRENLGNFLMDLDNDLFTKFVEFAEKKEEAYRVKSQSWNMTLKDYMVQMSVMKETTKSKE